MNKNCLNTSTQSIIGLKADRATSVRIVLVAHHFALETYKKEEVIQELKRTLEEKLPIYS